MPQTPTSGSRSSARKSTPGPRWPPPFAWRRSAASCGRWCAQAARRCPGSITPVDEDLALSDLGRSLMVIRGTPLAIGRPFAVRPGTPADRLAMLREALAETVADPKFLAEMTAAQIDTYHIGADEVAQRFNAMISQPPEVVDAMGKYIKAGE